MCVGPLVPTSAWGHLGFKSPSPKAILLHLSAACLRPFHAVNKGERVREQKKPNSKFFLPLPWPLHLIKSLFHWPLVLCACTYIHFNELWCSISMETQIISNHKQYQAVSLICIARLEGTKQFNIRVYVCYIYFLGVLLENSHFA